MRKQPLLFFSLLSLSALAACENHPAATSQRAAPTAQPVASPLPTATAVTGADTTTLLSRALGPQLPGYELESFTQGDINQDQRPDFVAIFHTLKAEDSTATNRGFRYRRVALILNQGWPRLQLAATNDNVIDCIGCAHMAIFDAHRGVTIKGPYFSFESTDGGCTRSMEVRTFRYSKPQKNWFLHKVGRDTMECSDTTGEVTHQEKTTRDFGKIAFAKFESVTLD